MANSRSLLLNGIILGLFLAGGNFSVAWARPLLSEPVPTIGKHHFEAATGISERSDKFQNPESKYTTVVFPFNLKFGLNDKLDLGFNFDYLDHKIDQFGVRLSGSQGGRFSPELKWALNDYVSFFFQ